LVREISSLSKVVKILACRRRRPYEIEFQIKISPIEEGLASTVPVFPLKRLSNAVVKICLGRRPADSLISLPFQLRYAAAIQNQLHRSENIVRIKWPTSAAMAADVLASGVSEDAEGPAPSVRPGP